ncbi:uncharacterized protein Tco025E_02945 [Trypanosoma conorhini]|uniref:Uncharacterized protein n=1 Tax=Trypanosoma conorhini TaxID=83891 RepID=A0A422PZ84_9TRYP|nr:uncharacterized protein Tco025E_02945 [Trypanosoma conorhini]RNF23034.1 hypothetical protein Tco025E_02945 [Trypanosoma conorhini]
MSTGEGEGGGDRSGSCGKEPVSAASGCVFTPRRQTDEEGTDVIAQEARELLERMRVDLKQLKGSVDLRENTERLMSLKAARQLMAHRRMMDAAASQRAPHAGFFFVPMATAPMTRLTISGYQARVTQQQTFNLERVDAGPPPPPDPPPWNSSTSLQGGERATGEKMPGAPAPVQHRRLIPTRGMPSTANTLREFSGEGNCLQQSSFPKEHATGDIPDKMRLVSRVDEVWIRDYLRRLNIVARDPNRIGRTHR